MCTVYSVIFTPSPSSPSHSSMSPEFFFSFPFCVVSFKMLLNHQGLFVSEAPLRTHHPGHAGAVSDSGLGYPTLAAHTFSPGPLCHLKRESRGRVVTRQLAFVGISPKTMTFVGLCSGLLTNHPTPRAKLKLWPSGTGSSCSHPGSSCASLGMQEPEKLCKESERCERSPGDWALEQRSPLGGLF